jgi:hypothetical protein
MNSLDKKYQELLKDILDNGVTKKTVLELEHYLYLEDKSDTRCQKGFLYLQQRRCISKEL